MDLYLLKYVVIGLAVVIIGMCIFGIVNPVAMCARVMTVWNKRGSMAFAVGVRLLMGIALIAVADTSRYPWAFYVLGGLALAAAVALPLLGRKTMGKIIDAVLAWPPLAIRAWCLVGIAFGGFMAWNVI